MKKDWFRKKQKNIDECDGGLYNRQQNFKFEVSMSSSGQKIE